MSPRSKKLIPQVVTRDQMRQLTANILHSGMRDRAGLHGVRISIRAVHNAGPGQFILATVAEFVPDNSRTLDHYIIPGYDLYIIEGTFENPSFNPAEKLTRAEFLVDLLDRLDSFAESLKYSPALYEQVRAGVDAASHYLRGAFDISELCDLSYLEKEEISAPA